MIISLGGGFQLYTNQRTIGDGFGSQLDLVAAVGEFCRQRQERCHGADLVPQVALLHSSTAFYRTAPKLFDSLGQLNALLGTLNCLLDSQQVVEILLEHQVGDLIDRYPLVVVPEWQDLPGALVARLLGYVENGGRLLITGARALVPFEEPLGIERRASPRTEGCSGWIVEAGSSVTAGTVRSTVSQELPEPTDACSQISTTQRPGFRRVSSRTSGTGRLPASHSISVSATLAVRRRGLATSSVIFATSCSRTPGWR